MRTTITATFKHSIKPPLWMLAVGFLLCSFMQVKATDLENIIPYKGKITRDVELSSTSTWTIKQSGNVFASGMGETLLDFSFNIPGDYTIEINETDVTKQHHDECEHTEWPIVMNITVSPVRMTFDMSSLALSEDIIGGKDMTGSTLTISVFVETFNNQPVTLTYPQFRSAGIETTIEGSLPNPATILMPGINLLQYDLKGAATSGTYIMFDLIDYNGLTQCYYKQEMIP
ncbi:MAG: hypothetical protein M0R38_00535 [Bacteroidia bacterium]|nr:hypothetical protein [Bacteroidia bacterium]